MQSALHLQLGLASPRAAGIVLGPHFPSSSHLKAPLTSLSLWDIRHEMFSNWRGLFHFSLSMEDEIWAPSPPRVPTPARFFVHPVCFSPLKVFIKMQELLLEGPTYSCWRGAAASEVSEAIHKWWGFFFPRGNNREVSEISGCCYQRQSLKNTFQALLYSPLPSCQTQWHGSITLPLQSQQTQNDFQLANTLFTFLKNCTFQSDSWSRDLLLLSAWRSV